MRINPLAVLLAPPLCAICATEARPAEDLCRQCLDRLAREGSPALNVPGADAAWAARPYAGAARELVASLKFGGRLALARFVARVIASEAPPWLLSGVVVPVPPSPVRRAWRGFDPAEEIALALARDCGLPVERLLIRSRGPRQVGRPRRERIADPPRVRARGPAPGTVVVVDDVATTGATLGACAAALRAAGATRVVTLAFACTPTVASRVGSPLRAA